MFLTTKGRYAVMAIVDIAYHFNNMPTNLKTIAERQSITLNFLEQIFFKLRKRGIVKSVRGPGGGYVIAKQPEELRVLEILEAVEEQMKMTRCSNDKKVCMPDKTRCLTHHLWQGFDDTIRDYFGSKTIKDVCKSNTLEEVY